MEAAYEISQLPRIDMPAAMDNCFFNSLALYYVINNLPFPEGLFQKSDEFGEVSCLVTELKEIFSGHDHFEPLKKSEEPNDELYEKIIVLGVFFRDLVARHLLNNQKNRQHSQEIFLNQLEFINSGTEVDTAIIEAIPTDELYSILDKPDVSKINYWQKTGYIRYCHHLAKPGVKVSPTDFIPILEELKVPYHISIKDHTKPKVNHNLANVHPLQLYLEPDEGHFYFLTNGHMDQTLIDSFQTSCGRYNSEKPIILSTMVHDILPEGFMDGISSRFIEVTLPAETKLDQLKSLVKVINGIVRPRIQRIPAAEALIPSSSGLSINQAPEQPPAPLQGPVFSSGTNELPKKSAPDVPLAEPVITPITPPISPAAPEPVKKSKTTYEKATEQKLGDDRYVEVDNPGQGNCAFYAMAIALMDRIKSGQNQNLFDTWCQLDPALLGTGDKASILAQILEFDNSQKNADLLNNMQISLRRILYVSKKKELKKELEKAVIEYFKNPNGNQQSIRSTRTYNHFGEIFQHYYKNVPLERNYNDLIGKSVLVNQIKKLAADCKEDEKNQAEQDVKRNKKEMGWFGYVWHRIKRFFWGRNETEKQNEKEKQIEREKDRDQKLEDLFIKNLVIDEDGVKQINPQSDLMSALESTSLNDGVWGTFDDLRQISESLNLELAVLENGRNARFYKLQDGNPIILNNMANYHWTTYIKIAAAEAPSPKIQNELTKENIIKIFKGYARGVGSFFCRHHCDKANKIIAYANNPNSTTEDVINTIKSFLRYKPHFKPNSTFKKLAEKVITDYEEQQPDSMASEENQQGNDTKTIKL